MKDLDYFREFFDKPETFNNNNFYEMAKEWGAYMTENEDALDNFDEDEWGDISNRVLDEFDRRSLVRQEFDGFNELFEAARNNKDIQLKIVVQKKWLGFMKRNQFDYEFTDEQISKTEEELEQYLEKVKQGEMAKKKLAKLEAEHKIEIEKLDDDIAEYYERTGKRPVFTSLKGKKKIKGN